MPWQSYEMTFAHALPFSISVVILQYIAASKHDLLYVTYSYLAVSTEVLDCERIKQSQMKVEKKLARNEAINASILHCRSHSELEGGGENTNLHPDFGVCLELWGFSKI